MMREWQEGIEKRTFYPYKALTGVKFLRPDLF